MDHLHIIEQGPLSTSFVEPSSSQKLYSVESKIHPERGWWSSIICRVESDNETYTQLATVSYLDWGTTRVTFGARQVELDAFLRKSSMTTNSRIFIAPNGQTYKWRVNGRNLELYHRSSQVVLARSHAPRSGLKRRPGSLEFIPKGFLSKLDPQTLDSIIITYVVMAHLLRERLKYGSALFI